MTADGEARGRMAALHVVDAAAATVPEATVVASPLATGARADRRVDLALARAVWQRNRDVFARLWSWLLIPNVVDVCLSMLALGLGLGAAMTGFGGDGYAAWIAPGLVVTSALSFSAPWETPMLTLPDAPFTVPSAPVPEVDVVTVGVEAPLAVREGAGWKAVTIPYAGRNSAMTVIIPAEGEDIEIAAPAVLAEAVPQLTTPVEPSLVALSMPAFAIDTPLGGIQNLRGTSLFEPGVDLFPMSDDPEGRPLRVDSLHQRTFVRVDAAGTSLTESTIEARDTDAMPLADAEPFVVAGPFAFVIHDTATGIPLIVGWVGDAPTPS